MVFIDFKFACFDVNDDILSEMRGLELRPKPLFVNALAAFSNVADRRDGAHGYIIA